MRALVLGATGVVGDAIVRAALLDDRIASILTVTRRPLTHAGLRLQSVIHQDFTDFQPLTQLFGDVDVVLCALGVSWSQAGGEAAYRQITHDYVMACARTVSVANASVRFCFVSGHGASSTSSQAWARIKAETERDLGATFGSRLHVFRPGYVRPVHGRDTPYWGDTIMRPFVPFRSFLTRYMTDSTEVARAVLYAATGGSVTSPADNREIIAAAMAYASARVS